MPENFIESSRDQVFLLPPSLRDWLPADHLAWFVIDAVDELKLSAFFGISRERAGRADRPGWRSPRSLPKVGAPRRDGEMRAFGDQ
jgi:hypothetical protein